MVKSSSFILIFIAIVLATGCGSGVNYEATDPAPRWDTAKELSEVNVALPYAKGQELVEINCVPCHSLRYIEMQPIMPRKTWEKIVTKMIKNFGAPVRDSTTAAEIVDYLVAIRGKEH